MPENYLSITYQHFYLHDVSLNQPCRASRLQQPQNNRKMKKYFSSSGCIFVCGKFLLVKRAVSSWLYLAKACMFPLGPGFDPNEFSCR